MPEQSTKIINSFKPFVAVLLVLAIVAVGAFFIFNKHNNKRKLTAIYEYSQACSVISLVKENHLLEKYLPDDVTVEWTMMDSGSDRRDAIATDRAQIGVIENLKVITSLENDYPLRILANGPASYRGIYTANSDINSAADLKDKKIAYQGTGAGLTLKKDLAENYHINLTDNQLLSLNEQQLIDLITQNQVDAAVMTRVMASKALQIRPEIKMIHSLTEETAKIGATYWFIGSVSYFDQNPDLLEPVMKAYTEAIETINNDPKAVAEQLAPLFEVDAEIIEQEFLDFAPIVEVYGYDEIAEMLYENGELEKTPKKFSEIPYYESIPKKAEQ
ncbi:MAG: ABC transporter substrate-binding protein [Candidatus Saccharibacteria bacterium]|nr:ABC transporter substrate-binding protein [Candidatus Saccharibacteria bacterium]